MTKAIQTVLQPIFFHLFCSMIEKIQALEVIARTLDPSADTRKDVWQQAQTYTENFLNTLPQKKAYQKADCPRLSQLKIGEEGQPLEKFLAIMEHEIDHAGINSTGAGHLGYIPGGALWTSSIGDLMAAISNRYVGVYFASPGGVLLENQLIRWLCDLVGFPASAHGTLTSGGSIASLIALHTAREVHKISSENVRKSVIYYTEQMHHCLIKAIHISGLSETITRIIPVNSSFEMETQALRKQIEEDISEGLQPFLIVATAGTTDTGAVDPLDEIAKISQEYNTWYHVDAAYGGFFLLVESMKHRFRGLEMADSLVMDPHKGLFLPFGTGVALIRDGKALVDAHTHHASYMIDAYGFDEISPADCGPELTRHFRGLRMWLPLHFHGLGTFRACLEEKSYLCQYFYQQIQEIGFEVGPPPALSVALFRYPTKDSNTFNKKLVKAIHQDGRYFLSSTVIHDEVWIRCAVLNFRTHLAEIDGTLQMIKEQLQRLLIEVT